ncbi:MAG TPA: hypothetical protein VL947_05255 [Cytophagales bacterium]|nr:hypothetical protein [Cytophagales bacterium]
MVKVPVCVSVPKGFQPLSIEVPPMGVALEGIASQGSIRDDIDVCGGYLPDGAQPRSG